jgi:hypothetical protein
VKLSVRRNIMKPSVERVLRKANVKSLVKLMHSMYRMSESQRQKKLEGWSSEELQNLAKELSGGIRIDSREDAIEEILQFISYETGEYKDDPGYDPDDEMDF